MRAWTGSIRRLRSARWNSWRQKSCRASIKRSARSSSGDPMTTRRFKEQRWLLDNVIRSVGIDWDQPRSVSYNASCGPEANADFAAIRARVQKFADISPAFETVARRREAKARDAEKAGE